MKGRRAGFSITELLVVVIVIGVLAAVVLPKFTKTLETYKAAEAEHMLEAVRNEQEARCELGDGYTSDTSKLGTWATDTSKYFNYSLQECGMSAARVGADYTLQIPLYEDGRICCDGCDTLNKDYLSCDELRSSLPTSCPCAAEAVTTPPPSPEPCAQTPKPDTSCGCKGTGHYSATWNTSTCSWDIGTTCMGEDTSGCCVKTAKPTSPGCGCKETGHFEYTWDEDSCSWQQGSECVGEDASQCKYEFEVEDDYGYIGYQAKWNGNTAVWEDPRGKALYINHEGGSGARLTLPIEHGGYRCKNPTKPVPDEYNFPAYEHTCANCYAGIISGTNWKVYDMATEPYCSDYGGASAMCKSCPSDRETCDSHCVLRRASTMDPHGEMELRPETPELRPYRNPSQWVNYNGGRVFSCSQQCEGLSALKGDMCAGGYMEFAQRFTCKLKE